MKLPANKGPVPATSSLLPSIPALQPTRKETEQRFDLLIDAVDYAIFILSPEGVVRTWNRGAERLKGYAAREIIGQHFSVFYLPEDAAAGKPQLEIDQALSTGRYEEEGWRVRKDGSRFWANVVLAPMYDEQKVLRGFAKVTRDFTERRRMMDELTQSEERFRLLVQSVRDYAIFMLNPDGYVMNWNEGAKRAKGYQATEIVGRHFSIFYTQEDRAKGKPSETLRSAEKDGRVEDIGWRVKKDGTRFWADVVITAVRDKHGKLIGYTKVTRDITQQRQDQDRLRNQQVQIYELQKLEVVARLAGGIAHDFNNIIAGILGCAEALAPLANDRPSAKLDIEEIQQACDRARTLTRQLMAYSRRQLSSPQNIQMNDVLSDILTLMKRTLGSPITVHFQPEADLPLIHADRGQVEQVISNLLLNARDAMPKGGAIWVRTQGVMMDEVSAAENFSLRPGRYVLISISDNGVGMSPDVFSHLFEPFFTTKEVGKGTGLGLATVYGIINQHQGGISVHSTLDLGTTFKIFFAALGGDFPSPENRSQEADAERVASDSFSETIMVVEDEPTVLRNTVRALQAQGYTVLSASNGREALSLFEKVKSDIHLLLTDVIMPDLNGKQLVDEVHKKLPKLPVLYMSGYAAELIAEQGILPSGTFIVEKPFNTSTLSQKIRDVLKEKKEK
jgi:PAS domain S-box-containing protein